MPEIKKTTNLNLEKPEAAHNAWEAAYWRLATIIDLWLTQLAKGHTVISGGNLTLDVLAVDLDATVAAFAGQASTHTIATETPIAALATGNTYVVYIDNAGAVQVSTLDASGLWSGALPTDFVLLGLVYEVEGSWTIHNLPLITGRGKSLGLASLGADGLVPLAQMPYEVIGWFLGVGAYVFKSKDISAQETYIQGVALSSDGTKMYIVGNTNKTVYQFSLSIPWNVSTATYASKSKLVSGEATAPSDLAFSSDESKMYIVDTASDKVFQYDLSTPGDVSTATYASKFKSVSSEETAPNSLAISSDGVTMCVQGGVSGKCHKYNLSTPGDVNTATYTGEFITVTGEDASPIGLAFNSNGTKMYMAGAGNDKIYQYLTGIITTV